MDVLHRTRARDRGSNLSNEVFSNPPGALVTPGLERNFQYCLLCSFTFQFLSLDKIQVFKFAV